MAIYEFELPDGTIVEAEGPDGLSNEEAQRMGMQHPEVQRLLNPPPPTPEIPPVINQQLGGQPGIPVASDVESQVGFGQPLGDTGKRLLGETAGAIGGFALGGPVGGAAGYALADQLLDKYLEGKEITAKGAAKSLATGALYEILPRGIGRQAKKLIPKDLPNTLMNRAIKVSPGIDNKIRKEVIQYGLDNGLTVGRKGIDQTEKFLYEALTKVNTQAEKLAAQGHVISIDDAMGVARKHIDETMGQFAPGQFLPGTGKKRLDRYKYLEEIIEPSLREYGSTLPVQTALPMRRGFDKLLASEFKRQSKTGSKVFSTIETDAMMSLSKGLREGLNIDPVIKALNEKMSKRLRWMEHVQPRVTRQGTTNLIPSEVILPLAMESMTKGGPGIATALGVTRAASSNPRVLSSGALMLRSLKNAQNKIPPAYQSIYLHNLFEDFMDKGDGLNEK